MPQYKTYIIEVEVTVNSGGTAGVEILPVEGVEGNEKLIYNESRALENAVFSVIRNIKFDGSKP